MRVPCTNCGERPVSEFIYAPVVEVPDTVSSDAERDLSRVFMRENTDGIAAEAWFHSHGCRRWSYLTRHRTTGAWL